MAKNHFAYPQYSFSASLELAEKVRAFGGKVDANKLAASLHRTNSGAFRVLVNAGVKYGIFEYRNYIITLTESAHEILATEDAARRMELMREAFLKPPVYRELMHHWKVGDVNERNMEETLNRWSVDKAHIVKRNFLRDSSMLGLLGISSDALMNASEEQDSHDEPREEIVFADSMQGNLDITQESKAIRTPLLTHTMDNHLPRTQIAIETPEAQPTSAAPEPQIKMRVLLSGQRYAEFLSATELTAKDYEILKMQLETWKLHAESI